MGKTIGFIFSIIAGILISFQSVFNTRVSSKLGLFETTIVVHITGLLVSIILTYFLGDGDFSKFREVKPYYYLGGALGVFVVFSTMKAIDKLSPSVFVGIMLISQLLVSTLIDVFGLFDTEKIEIAKSKPLGLIIMIIGLIIFQKS